MGRFQPSKIVAVSSQPDNHNLVATVPQAPGDLPAALLERIEHYFSTYKLVPGEPPRISITGRYGFDAAAQVIRAAIDDYLETFGGIA